MPREREAIYYPTATTPSDGDSSARKGVLDPSTPGNLIGTVGRTAKSSENDGMFAAYELDIPKGSTIIGVQVNMLSALDFFGVYWPSRLLKIGITVTSSSIAKYRDGDGWALSNYSDDSKYPHPTNQNSDLIKAGRLFQDKFSAQSAVIVDEWTPDKLNYMGDGTYGSNLTAVTSTLVADFQAFIDSVDYDPGASFPIGSPWSPSKVLGLSFDGAGYNPGNASRTYFRMREDSAPLTGPYIKINYLDTMPVQPRAEGELLPRVTISDRTRFLPRVSTEASSMTQRVEPTLFSVMRPRVTVEPTTIEPRVTTERTTLRRYL